MLIPANGPTADIETLLERLDGIMLTGSRSNVHPSYYDGPPHADGTWEDMARDSTTLPLIRAAVARGVPVLAICRGFQELNVALGGSLHQRLQDLPDRIDHSSPMVASRELRIGKAHAIRVTPGGWLHRLSGASEIAVGSLHNQGVDKLAPGVRVEGVAPDGTIEAVHVLATAAGPVPGLRRRRAVASRERLANRHRLPPHLRRLCRGGACLCRGWPHGRGRGRGGLTGAEQVDHQGQDQGAGADREQ